MGRLLHRVRENMLKIIDLSQYEDNPADPRRVDFAAMKAGGVSAAYFRCGNGTQIDTAFR